MDFTFTYSYKPDRAENPYWITFTNKEHNIEELACGDSWESARKRAVDKVTQITKNRVAQETMQIPQPEVISVPND